MLRRSTRRKVTEDSNPDSQDIPNTKNTPIRKRAKKAAEPVNEPSESKPQRKRGKLRFMTEVPLDVLFEIFGQLLPVDILNLSCASKALRDILLRKSAAFVWKRSFSNVPFPTPPPCPDDLNEAQYANLLWRKHCFFCGASKPVAVAIWICRVRACDACVRTANFTSLGSWIPNQPANTLDTAKTLCPKWWYCRSSRPRRGEYVCLTSELEAIQKRLDELAETNSGTEEFVLQCTKTRDVKTNHAHRCRNWESNLKINRRDELKDVGESRKNAILAKIDELGWSNELSDYNTKRAFLALPAVKQNKELTERVWANIEPELVAWFAEVKEQRLIQERVSVLVDRIRVLMSAAKSSLDAIPLSARPSKSDLCTMPEYRAILERSDPPDFNEGDCTDLLAHLSEQTDEWRNSNINLLLELLPSGSTKGKKKLDAHTLDLCTTFFRCHSCREPISYPRILNHACLKKGQEPEDEEDYLLEIFQKNEAPWIHGHKGIAFDAEASNIMAMLIRLCGQDPKTVTTAAMDELDSRFECPRCVHPTQGRLVMTWRMALLHELEDHYGETLKATSYSLLGPDEVIAAKEREAKVKKQGPPSLLCAKCVGWRSGYVYTTARMQSHMKYDHAGESFEPVLVPDLTIRIPPFAVRLKNSDA
ncbi:hypothetical protein K438DRAFT_1805505 [Mycena galopus ATCC 62051]|nr:hypothetical protein K438DRAFT_1805505 [Mycena galopus ATCC 62051]